MKWIITALALCFTLNQAEAKPISKKEKAAVTVVLQKYVDAFDQGDLKALKKVVTEEFIELSGGDSFEKYLERKEKKSGRKVHNIRWNDSDSSLYVQFDILDQDGRDESMDEEEWFMMEKAGGAWKIHRKETDMYEEV